MDNAFEYFAMHQVFDVEPLVDEIVEKIEEERRYNPDKTDFSFDIPDYINDYDADVIKEAVYRRLNAN